MKTLFIDSVSGISGNMMIGALLDLGANKEILLKGLKDLNLEGYDLVFERKNKNGIDSYYFNTILTGENVDSSHHHNHEDHEHHENH
ncbi:MAG: DUF111 family protein [Tissierellia bacterium]|nr:DUF111 family protein [Tissierellia bacterium]